MPHYTAHVTRTTHLVLEVNTDDPTEADAATWEQLDEAEEIDTVIEIEFIKDEDTKRLYRWSSYRAKWEAVKEG